MALDTKYRPRNYGDVLGQEETISVLREFVKTGSGFHQSYLFCGPFGGGKTTLARILARALLCEAPEDGAPCDKCESCNAILTNGSSDCFTEFDAATNSGKDSIKSITDMIGYDTVSGKRRLYLMDEAHRLSKDALDALLKPMEDTVSTGEDKQLVCIFCTTEPEKMRATIFSRCAPAFIIRPVPAIKVAERLALVCAEEQIPYEMDALLMVAESTEGHIRDALKSIEGLAKAGGASVSNTLSYLRLGANPIVTDILSGVGVDIGDALSKLDSLSQTMSPATVYDKLAEAAMLAYTSVVANRRVPSYWKAESLRAIHAQHGDFLLTMASTFGSRPPRSTFPMLTCDIASLHHQRMTPRPRSEEKVAVDTTNTSITGKVKESPLPATPFTTSTGVYVDVRAVNQRKTIHPDATNLSVGAFREVLEKLLGSVTHDEGSSGGSS